MLAFIKAGILSLQLLAAIFAKRNIEVVSHYAGLKMEGESTITGVMVFYSGPGRLKRYYLNVPYCT